MNTNNRTISIIGCGYVGLVTGACLSFLGKKIICIDNNQKIINSLNSGKLTIYEKNLKKIFDKTLNKKLFFSNNLQYSIENSSTTIIAVGTPLKNNKIDYKILKTAIKDLAIILKKKNSFHLILVKSTVLPTTCEKIIIPILEKVF